MANSMPQDVSQGRSLVSAIWGTSLEMTAEPRPSQSTSRMGEQRGQRGLTKSSTQLNNEGISLDALHYASKTNTTAEGREQIPQPRWTAGGGGARLP